MNIGKITLFPTFLAQPIKPATEVKDNKLERQPETDEFTKEIMEVVKELEPTKPSDPGEALRAEKAKAQAEFQKRIKEPQKFSKESK